MSKKATTLYLDSHDLALLRQITTKQDTNVSKLLRRWIKRYISKNRALLKEAK